MKKIFVTAAALTLTLGASAQGNNTGMGGDHEGCTSLAERVLKLEKKNDAFNVYINYAASFQETDNGTKWGSAFKNRQARLEFMGHLTDKISYRFRHRLNSGNNAQSEDNFAAATDVLWVGYQFNEKLGVHAGKVCQYWGGFEYDENPMYIYQFSDMGNNIDIFKAGVNVSYRPVASQELTLSITDAYSNKFAEEYGEGAYSLEADGTKRILEASNHPLTYIFGWNGNFFGDKLQTRWSWGIQTEAKHKYSRMLFLGQKLNLPRVQWYFDYMGAFEGLDRLRIASREGAALLADADHPDAGPGYFSDVHYHSFVTKLNWQFVPQWNLMVKGMYEMASVDNVAAMKDFRKSYGYLASVEYFPVKGEDFRVFLAYTGRKFDYSKECGLQDYDTNRIELGLMYRLKMF